MTSVSQINSPNFRHILYLQETKRASSEQLGDYVHLNEYKLDRVLGQGSYGMVKLAYNKEENKNYVRTLHLFLSL